jgi:hypothetical protein
MAQRSIAQTGKDVKVRPKTSTKRLRKDIYTKTLRISKEASQSMIDMIEKKIPIKALHTIKRARSIKSFTQNKYVMKILYHIILFCK